MKELIRRTIGKESHAQVKKLKLAEFLQHLILQSLYRQGIFKHVVFTGGTALRILYQTGRYSEDLDFSLEKAKGFNLNQVLKGLGKDLGGQQLPFEFRLKNDGAVARSDLRFAGVMKEFGLSSMSDQKLTIKLEIDKRPPAGGGIQTMLVTEPVSYQVAVYDLPSLFATKLHAIFFRGYAKGRDYYDLIWYLGRKVAPNFHLLNNAIRQTHGKGHEVGEDQFKDTLTRHLEKIDFRKLRSEVERFIIDPEEVKFLNLESVKSLLRHYDPHECR